MVTRVQYKLRRSASLKFYSYELEGTFLDCKRSFSIAVPRSKEPRDGTFSILCSTEPKTA